MNRLVKGARIAVKECMNVQPGEEVLILTDANMPKSISEALLQACKELEAKAQLKMIKPLERNGQEPDQKIARLMKKPDVLLAPTSKSLSHTKARRDASKEGVRIATMPGITEFSFIEGGLTADYHEVNKLCNKMYDNVKNATEIHVTSNNGTDVRLYFGQYVWDRDEGLYHKPGKFGNLPAGEVDTAPIERACNGIAVFDTMGKYGRNVQMKVENGLVKKIEGSNMLKAEIKKVGPKAKVIAELGIGCNPKAKVIGNILEDEKVFGTVHIALGNNMSYGGKNDVQLHLDGIVLKPTLIADGIVLIENGKWKI